MAKAPVIKAYGISHAEKTIIGFCSYECACFFVDEGVLDWCGDAEQFRQLDKTGMEDYSRIISMRCSV